MDDSTIGRLLRAIRHERAWRQADVASRAGVSQAAISLVERGHLDSMPLRRLRQMARALDADLVVTLRWRGADLDRVLDEGHAALLGQATEWLERLGWGVKPEVTFAVYGERGSIDLLAWHEPTRIVLVVEIKTELASIEETLRRHDVKARLAAGIAARAFGRQSVAVARLLVLPGTATARRRVARHEGVLARAYPARGADVRRWIREPEGALSGLLFATIPSVASRRARPRRVPKRASTPELSPAGDRTGRAPRAGGRGAGRER